MHGINVVGTDDEVYSFTDANTWHVDDRGQLHVNQDSEPRASFARDGWRLVACSDDGSKRANVTLDPCFGEAMNKAHEASALLNDALRKIEGESK